MRDDHQNRLALSRRAFLAGATALGGATLLGACQPTPAAPAAVPPRAGDATAQDQEWEQLVAAARQEGVVGVYGPPGDSFRNALTQPFERAYPGIQVEGTFGSGGSVIVPRLLAERTAGRFIADVYVHGAGPAVDTLKPAGVLSPLRSALMLTEVLDTSAWLENRLWWSDRHEPYVALSFQGSLQLAAFYNSQLVDPSQMSSYWDLVDPKWRGRIIARDIRQTGPGTVPSWFMYRHPQLGPQFLNRLFGETDITLGSDQRQMIDWLGQGRFAFALFLNPPDVYEARAQGLPVEIVPASRLREGSGIGSGAGSVSLIDRAPHPNAAKVYINWLLSRDGQMAWQTHLKEPSLRLDIPKDGVEPARLPAPGVKYDDTSVEDYGYLDGKEIRELVTELVNAALERGRA